jgi:hypothetical protein
MIVLFPCYPRNPWFYCPRVLPPISRISRMGRGADPWRWSQHIERALIHPGPVLSLGSGVVPPEGSNLAGKSNKKRNVGNQRIDPMTRSAISLLFQSVVRDHQPTIRFNRDGSFRTNFCQKISSVNKFFGRTYSSAPSGNVRITHRFYPTHFFAEP